jgi:hypothetical protein
MSCPNCGYDNSPNNRFCVRCGVDLAVPPQPGPPGAAPGAPPAPPAGRVPPPAPANPWGAPPPPPTQWGAPGQTPPPPPPPPQSAPPNPYAPPAAHGPPGVYAPPGAGQYGQYPAPYPPSGYHAPSTNGLAIAALVLGLVGWVPCGVGSILAIVFGFVARTQIRNSQGRQGGDGLAMAGIVLGFVAIAFWIALFVIGTISNSNSVQS